MDPSQAEIEALRAQTPAQKLRTLEGMIAMAWTLQEAALRKGHPDWTDEEVRRTARRIVAGAAP